MPKITIYSTSTCPYCKMLKSYLNDKNIEFEDVVLDEQEGEQTKIDTCGQQGVPCTHIVRDDGSELDILGFDKPKINEALGIQ